VGLRGTEPFHWDGDMTSFDHLMTEVFVGRMGGGEPDADQIEAMGSWLNTLKPAPRSVPLDPDAVARGQALFASPVVGCATCHNGAKFTNNTTVNVGTGGPFQVPSLIGIADRAPFIHTGCADSLRARFTDPACSGGDQHGVISGLSAQDIDDLVAFLETL
jgi:mono/diheme cytochrome c family protein